MAEAMPELMEFSADPDEEGSEPQSYTWIYWQRPDDWIVIGPGWPSEYVKRIRRGFKPLEQFGSFYLDRVKDRQNWSAAREPYRQLFALGGQDVFPVSQIVEHNWDAKPPYKGAKFPQLEGIEVVRKTCNICKRKFIDGSLWGGLSADERLSRHEEIAHQKASDREALARGISEALRSGGSAAPAPSDLGDAIKALIAQNQELISELHKERRTTPRSKKSAVKKTA